MTRDIAKLRARGKAEIAQICDQEYQRLVRAGAEAVADPSSLRHVRLSILPAFADADYLATKCQSIHIWDLRLVYLLAPLASFFAGLYVLSPQITEWWGARTSHQLELVTTVAECAALVLVVVRYYFARLGASHRCWIDCRFLAEMLRSAAILACAGMRPPRALASVASEDWTLHRYNEAIEAFGADAKPETKSHSHTHVVESQRKFLSAAWLIPQREFHDTRASTYELLGSKASTAALTVFLLSLACSVMALLFELKGLDQSFFRFGSLVLPAAGAAIVGYSGHREYERLSHRSAEQVRELERIRDQLASPNLSTADAERLAHELRDSVVQEVKSWRLLVRFTEVKLG